MIPTSYSSAILKVPLSVLLKRKNKEVPKLPKDLLNFVVKYYDSGKERKKTNANE